MKVQILTATPTRRRPGRGWSKGIISATADGCRVTYLKDKGWLCRCSDADCQHIASVIQVISPEALARINAGRPAC